jgi:hypothetical protein
MAAYDPPNHIPPLNIFNPDEYAPQDATGISQAAADARYLRLSGGVLSGTVSFNAGLSCTTQIINATANAINPSYSFIADPNSGLWSGGVGIINVSCGSSNRLSISTSLLTSTNPINLPSGSNTAPAVQIGATGTGIYSSAANTLNFATNSTNQLAISTTAITSTLPIFCPSTTTITNCGLQVGLANTGLQYNAGVLYFGLGGTQMMRYQAAQIYSSVPHNFTNGSAAAPSLTAASYQTTGLYWSAGPTLNITAGGVQRANITGTSLQLNGIPLDANGNNVQNAPQVGNAAGNLELRMNSTGAGGTLTLTGGTGLLSGTSGGSSGQHLVITINGVNYKIPLNNP